MSAQPRASDHAGLKWFLVVFPLQTDREGWASVMEEHFVWMREQHDQGRVLMSGPDPERTRGTYLLRAPSRDDAERIARTEPWTARGMTEPNVIEWQVHEIMGVGGFSRDEKAET